MLSRLAPVVLASIVLAGAGQAPDLPPRDGFLREVRDPDQPAPGQISTTVMLGLMPKNFSVSTGWR